MSQVRPIRGEPRGDASAALTLARIASASVALCGIYVGLAEAGQSLGNFGAYSIWYLPAGVSLAVSMLWGWKWWPVLAASELISGIVVFHVDTHHFTWPLMIINASIYTGIYVLGGAGLRRAGITDRADRVRDVLILVAVGAVLAPFAGALFGVAMRLWAGLDSTSHYWHDVRVWWVGDALGIATIAPGAMVLGLLLGVGGRRLVPPALRRQASLVTVVQLLAPAAAAAVLLGLWGYHPAVLSLLTIPVVGVALRFGVGGTALATLILAPTMAAVGNAELGDVLSRRADVQVLLLGIVAVGFLVGSVVDERERSSQRHRELAQIVESTSDLVAVVALDGKVRYLNRAGRRLARVQPGQDVHDLREDDLYAPGAHGPSASEAQASAVRDRVWSGDVSLRRGEEQQDLTTSKVVIAHYARDGTPLRTTSIVRDVTEGPATGPDREALTDSVTGLPNRTGFLAQLAQSRRRLEYGRTSAALLAVDFDRLAELRAPLGHRRTDALLAEIGTLLVALAGSGAVVGRVDSVRFAILSGDASQSEVEGLGVAVCAVSVPVTVDGGTISVSPRVGVSDVPGHHPDEADALLAAEVAAHDAVTRGSDEPVHDVDHRRAAKSALILEAQLRRALAQRLWRLAYQPIVDAASRRVTGAEALLRFDQNGPASSPFSLILLAEQLGLIQDLGRQVLAAACGEATKWPSHLSASVNVSRHQLNPDFVATVREVLDGSGLAPDRLVLEVTESALAADPRGLSESLAGLHRLGVRIALDDFGTGYSSLASLDMLPVDMVKLDASFTRGLAESDRKRALVGAVVMLAHALGITVIAEGIESPDELSALVELGCDEVQGYLLARPGSATVLHSLPSLA